MSVRGPAVGYDGQLSAFAFRLAPGLALNSVLDMIKNRSAENDFNIKNIFWYNIKDKAGANWDFHCGLIGREGTNGVLSRLSKLRLNEVGRIVVFGAGSATGSRSM